MYSALVTEQLADLYGLRGDAQRSWVFRHPRAIAQYEVGHLARLADVERKLAATPGLFLTGSSYRGIAVNHCVKEAATVARRVCEYLVDLD